MRKTKAYCVRNDGKGIIAVMNTPKSVSRGEQKRNYRMTSQNAYTLAEEKA
jgi:hypothetical protein